MLSIPTKQSIAEFFVLIATGERAVEVSRQQLAESRMFSPWDLYKHLDRSKLGISASDIAKYMMENKYKCDLESADYVIKAYDGNNDRRLSYADFC